MKNENNGILKNEDLKTQLKVVYVAKIGTNTDGDNIYHLLISNDSDKVWGEGWEKKPACAERNLTPEDDMYEYVAEFVTDIKLDLAQNNCCFSMQDARDNIVALANENLDNAEEYPEQGRIVIHFGEILEDVEIKLSRRDIYIKYV